MTADLGGSRLLYLPALAVGLFCGLLVEGCGTEIRSNWLSSGLLIPICCVKHNLLIRCEVALVAQRSRRAAVVEIGSHRRYPACRILGMAYFFCATDSRIRSVEFAASDKGTYLRGAGRAVGR